MPLRPLLFAMLLALAAPARAEDGPPLTLEQVLADVSRAAPALAVEDAEIDVARARVGVAGAWDDPTVGLMAEEVPLPGGMGEPMLTWRFTQTLNVFGRRAAAKDAARGALQGAEARRRRVEWDARTRAAGLFFELWMIGEMGGVLARQIEALELMRSSALARYSAGLMMAHHDILRAEAEVASMQAEQASLAEERLAVAAMLNALRGRPAQDDPGAPVLPEQPPVPDLDALTARVPSTPEIAEAEAMRAEAEAQRRLAEKMYLPMVMVGAFYEQRTSPEMDDTWGGELSLSVPLWWWDRQENEVAMAGAMVRRAERERVAMATMTDAEVRMAWSRARAAQRALAALEETALPRLRETVKADEAAYVSGTGDFLRWLEDLEALLGLEAQRLEAVVRREGARYELERLLAAPLASSAR